MGRCLEQQRCVSILHMRGEQSSGGFGCTRYRNTSLYAVHPLPSEATSGFGKDTRLRSGPLSPPTRRNKRSPSNSRSHHLLFAFFLPQASSSVQRAMAIYSSIGPVVLRHSGVSSSCGTCGQWSNPQRSPRRMHPRSETLISATSQTIGWQLQGRTDASKFGTQGTVHFLRSACMGRECGKDKQKVLQR